MRSAAVDGFELSYDRTGRGAPAVLLHGWPGSRSDYDEVVPLLAGSVDAVVPDLRGFGDSDKHDADPARHYDATAQARSIAGLIDELDLHRPVIAGYDVGSRVAQALAAARPDLVGALVVAPPLPGAGRRVLDEQPQREFWYQAFHRLPLAEELVDGNPDAVRAYLSALLDALVGTAVRPPAEPPRTPGGPLRGAGCLHGVDRLVPRRRRHGGHLPA